MGFSPSEFFPVVKRVPFRFPCPLNVRLLLISLGLMEMHLLTTRLPKSFEKPLIFRALPYNSPSFCSKCYPCAEPATLLGFCLAMAFSLISLNRTSPHYPSYASSWPITEPSLHFKGVRLIRSVFPSRQIAPVG